MIYAPFEVLAHLSLNNLDENGKPIIKVRDMIIFVEEPPTSHTYISYYALRTYLDKYFNYIEYGKESKTIRITALLNNAEEGRKLGR